MFVSYDTRTMYGTTSVYASKTHRREAIAICGAGVAGLVLAAKLAYKGHRPVVFESRTEAGAVTEGVFLTLAPNGMNGLRAIGAFDAVNANGIDTTGIEILNAKGKRLALANQADHASLLGAPSITISRGRLAQLLLEGARAAGVDVRFDACVTGVAASSAGIKLMLNSETWYDADFVVAADGLRSSVRDLVFPEYPTPHFTGLIGTGGITEAPIPDTGGVMRMTFGDDAFFGYVKAAGQPVYWFNSYAAEAAECGKVADPAAYARRIQAMHANDPDPNAEILRHVGKLDRSYPVYDMPELPAWHKGNIVLMGDAAHAVGPHAGQGASMAIEDALVLAACLDAERDPQVAFSRYEELRRPRIARVVKLTARNSSQKRATSWVGLLVRDLVLPFLLPLGIRTGRKLCEFRADLTPLAMPRS